MQAGAAALAAAADAVRSAERALVVVGAGISVAGGVPDFRTPRVGLFATLAARFPGFAAEDLFSAAVFSPAEASGDNEALCAFLQVYGEFAESLDSARPTPFHRLVADLANSKRLVRCYSQNVDCLQERTDMRDKRLVIPLHGDVSTVFCTKRCKKQRPFYKEYAAACRRGETTLCPSCAERGSKSPGILRPGIVLYGENHRNWSRQKKIIEEDLDSPFDLVLVVGTSLNISEVNDLVKNAARRAQERGGKAVFVGLAPPSAMGKWKEVFDLMVRVDCQDLARRVLDEEQE